MMGISDIHVDLPPAAQARARESVEHLQAATRELIAAARAGLDVAEEVVNDPEAAAAVVRTLSSVGELARYLSGLGVPGASADQASPAPGDGHGEPSPTRANGRATGDGRAQRSRVQRITVA
jgi:hypothetical protein